ncbi:PREDICTED: rho guanine nucleotide exchange factor 11-like [Amphimedon queenslandica]|uniref:Rho guanine nucleotide exchange factor 11 n=1 Tax=Amphimedon queenslandica TaxID=400682 RepID=A0A1X7UPQ2_AMPQE|nr:PREDICTED: rho guanine nucleotide exchange factor 11-like [Amphimedon queenslandica]|eukprot:XP_019852976.1 PREDICTED: rho guanine nucleotide exchange factor 11-like [Amphimedon queenslandica]
MSAGDSLSSVHSPPVYQSVQHLVDKKGRLWQEKTLVIKPNDHGYGFSLSGEKPVFVDSVVDGGPAYKAGIRPQDRLLKVDGQSVFDKTHTEVVNLLKGATVVSLTIITQYTQISRDQSDTSGGAGLQMIQELTLNALRTMLEKQQSTYEQLVVDYSKGASTKLEQEIRECEDTIKTLKAEIAVKASSVVDTVAQTTEASINTLLGSDKASERRGRLAREDSLLAQKILCTITADDESESSNFPSHHSSSSPSTVPQSSLSLTSSTATKYKSPKMFRKQSIPKAQIQQVDSAPHSRTASPTKVVRTQSVLNDSDLSDEDLEFGAPHYGPFSSLQELNNYPAHMSVFLHYLFQNKEPKYLCFYLVAHSYQNHYKGSELKQRGLEIMWTFCFPTSPLFVGLTDSVRTKILDTLENEENEMKLKSVFVESRDVVAYQIADDLTAYRHKRTLGLGSMYGEQQLTDHMTPAKESETSNTTLIRILKDIISDRIDGVEDINKNHALSDSVSTFLMDINKGKAKFDSSIADRMQSFTRTELSKRKSGKTKKQSKCGHSFQLSSYQKLTICHHCDRVLWGILYQGYQCSVCEMNVHRYGCIDENLETCSGKKKKKFHDRKASGGYTSSHSTSELDKDSEPPPHISAADNAHMFDDDSGFRSRRRSVSDPKQTLMGVNLEKEEQSVQEEIYYQKKKKSAATVSRTQSLKERRSDGTVPVASGHPQSSQDTSLNTTPSWTSVASSSSVSDESLNNSSLTSSSVPTSAGPLGTTGIIRGSTLDTVIEDGKGMRSKSPFFDEETLLELKEADVDEELIPWSLSTASSVVKRLQKFEVQRQELLKEFIHTERTHLKKLVTMKHIYRNPLYQAGLLSLQQTESLFPSLDRLVELHNSFCNELKERQAQYYDGVVHKIADIFLARFEGKPGEQLSNACAIFASNQSKAEKLIKEYSAKIPKFKKFLQDAEANQYCHRRSIKELLPCVWTRLTRYQLLLEQIQKLNKKHFDKLKPEDKEESEKLSVAFDCVRNILVYVNMVVKQTENRQKLQDYQSRLDSSQIDRSTHQITEKYKDINLTAEGRILLHEGILTWKISHRKTVEVKALLLSDILVLLHNQEDTDKVILKQYHIEPIGVGEVREEISPIIRVKEMILRHYATDKGGRSFLVVNNSQLMKRAQMYEFTAESAQEKKKWEDNIENAMKGKYDILPELLSPTIEEDTSFSQQIPLIPRMSTVALREQLDKIDDSIQKQLQEKLSLLRSLQAVNKDDSITSVTHASPANVVETSSIIFHTVGELTSQVSKLLVPNPTKQIVTDVQYQLAELTSHLHSGLSELLMSLGKEGILQTLERTTSSDDPPASPQLDETSDAATVSPSDEQYIMINESTPNATPLPNGTHSSPHISEHVPLALPSDDKRLPSVLNRGECIDQESDDDDEGGSPPPLPHKPPPSSSSASSATPPDLLDDETPPILPRACSEFSMESYDIQSDSYHQLIAPPEGFSDFPDPPPEQKERVTKGDSPPKRSMSDNVKKEGFRRVRSNPSIVSTKVMSVISSASSSSSGGSGNNAKFDSPSLPPSVLSNNSMKRTNSETAPLPDENEYVIKLKESAEGEN